MLAPALPCVQTRAVTEKTSELKSHHQAAVAALLARYQQLRSEVASYNKALQAVMAGQQQQQDAGSGRAGRDQQ
jgi:hypothetical protein